MNKSTLFRLMFVSGALFACRLQPAPPAPPPAPTDTMPPTVEEPTVEERETAAPLNTFTLSSPHLSDGAPLPVNFTCEGAAISPSIAWDDVPDNAVSLALIMEEKIEAENDAETDSETMSEWHWLVYNIPARAEGIELGTVNVGQSGINSLNEELGYFPPCPMSSGITSYQFTMYAISSALRFDRPQVTRDRLLEEISTLQVAKATLTVIFDRANPITADLTTNTATGDLCSDSGPFAINPRLQIECNENVVQIEHSGGLPNHEMMRGITGWILRVPIPFGYEGDNAWQFPVEPTWLDQHEATHARGPIAVAINGMPIYHFDKRPDVDLGNGYIYEEKFDTVQQGELDHCGGHAGQGDDYHYHTAPICLLDEHDLSQPIAYTLGGAEIFYGTGGTDYYGEGRYNDINNLPAEPLDECNAVQQADGSYVYYTTDTPPYTVGCHHEAVDWALQIEPKQMRDLGQFGRNATEIISLTQRGQEFSLVFRTDEGTEQAIVYRPASFGRDCWDIEFRGNPDTPENAERHCRVDLTE